MQSIQPSKSICFVHLNKADGINQTSSNYANQLSNCTNALVAEPTNYATLQGADLSKVHYQELNK